MVRSYLPSKVSEIEAIGRHHLNDVGDDEMEDVEEDEEEEGFRRDQQEDAVGHAAVENFAAYSDRMTVADSGNEVSGYDSTPMEKSSTPQLNRLFSPPLEQQRVASFDSRISRSGTLTIVDYGHDEVAMSPEPEEGEIDGSGRVMFGDQLHVTNGS